MGHQKMYVRTMLRRFAVVTCGCWYCVCVAASALSLSVLRFLLDGAGHSGVTRGGNVLLLFLFSH